MATLYPDDPAHTIAADIYGFENCEAPCRVIRVVSSVPRDIAPSDSVARMGLLISPRP